MGTLKRCCEMYGDRWCRLHGKCSCTIISHGSRVWGQRRSDCPLHGADVDHPNRIVAYLTRKAPLTIRR